MRIVGHGLFDMDRTRTRMRMTRILIVLTCAASSRPTAVVARRGTEANSIVFASDQRLLVLVAKIHHSKRTIRNWGSCITFAARPISDVELQTEM